MYLRKLKTLCTNSVFTSNCSVLNTKLLVLNVDVILRCWYYKETA